MPAAENDHVELATHLAGEWRRREEVRDIAIVPVAAIIAVQRLVGPP